jgi:elongation factor 1 alpha-like protein
VTAAGKGSFKWAWALDERPEERARGVTVDVAQAAFTTGRTEVTLLDAPGHRDFVPNAIAGVSRADVALLVVDASPGAFERGFQGGGQTREHLALAAMAGIASVIVVVNKMDACGYDEARFEEIKRALSPFAKNANSISNDAGIAGIAGFGHGSGFAFEHVAFVPASGIDAANLVSPEAPPPPALAAWWRGPTVCGAIDDVPVSSSAAAAGGGGGLGPTRFPVADVIADGGGGGGRGARATSLGPAAVGGKLERGSLRVGQRLLAQPSGVACVVRRVLYTGPHTTASAW